MMTIRKPASSSGVRIERSRNSAAPEAITAITIRALRATAEVGG